MKEQTKENDIYCNKDFLGYRYVVFILAILMKGIFHADMFFV